MKKVFQAYRILNILSLDVMAGAMICASFFAKIFSVTILPWGLISLGLTVWIIYTADHLLDARKIEQRASTKRHRFHQQYFAGLFLFVVLAAVVDAILFFFIRRVVFLYGLGLASMVILYMASQQQLRFFKELIGAILYTAGVLLIPLSVNENELPATQMVFIVQFGLTAWINILLFSFFDRERDHQDKQPSFANFFGEQKTQMSMRILFALNAMLTLVQLFLFSFPLTLELILIAMNTALLFIFINQNYFEKDERYRLLGDSVFLFPLVYFLIEQ